MTGIVKINADDFGGSLMVQTITKNMTFDQVLQTHPGAGKVLKSFNLGCVGCLGASTETLEQGSRAHGIDVNELIAALNALK